MISFVLAILRGVRGQTRAGGHLLAFLDLDMSAGGNRIAGEDFLLFADDDDLRMQVLLVLDDNRSHDAGRFVDFLADRHALDHVAELDPSRLFRDDRHVVGIPLDEGFPLLDSAAIGDGNHRADHDVVALEFASIPGMDADRAVLVEHDEVVLGAFDDLEVVETHDALVLRLDDRLLEGLAGGAADVERPHGELGSRLADRLRRDNADRFPELDGKPGREVASVTLGANASLGLAGQRRADLELLETDFLERRRGFLVDDLAGGDHGLAGDGVLRRSRSSCAR